MIKKNLLDEEDSLVHIYYFGNSSYFEDILPEYKEGNGHLFIGKVDLHRMVSEKVFFEFNYKIMNDNNCLIYILESQIYIISTPYKYINNILYRNVIPKVHMEKDYLFDKFYITYDKTKSIYSFIHQDKYDESDIIKVNLIMIKKELE